MSLLKSVGRVYPMDMIDPASESINSVRHCFGHWRVPFRRAELDISKYGVDFDVPGAKSFC